MRPDATAWNITAAHMGPPSAATSSAYWPASDRDVDFAGRRTANRPYWTGVRLVSLMAFGQSLVFLVIWLLICASAGAAVSPKAEFRADLHLSTYQSSKQRDPFGRMGSAAPEAKVVPGAPVSLQLDGILYEASSPSAIINGQLLTLNKTVTLKVGNTEVQVKALAITRDQVVLEANGQKVELNLVMKNSSAPSGP